MNIQHQTPIVAEIRGAIRNPADPHHYMVVQPVNRFVQIYIDGECVARTQNALRVIEIGGSALEPRLYIPEADVIAKLVKTDRTTHCPIKGHATYFSLNGEEVAWRYHAFDFAKVLDGHMSFASENLTITEGRGTLSGASVSEKIPQ